MGFKYIRKITLTNSGASDITTAFNIKLEFDNTNFDFTHCNSDGSDIRFFDSDQTTEIGYYIENWDSTNKEGTIYVKVGSIDANSTKDIYMKYGDSLLITSTSSGADTFPNASWISGTVNAYYKFENNANDTGGNYNGTWSGTEQYETGKFGQAAKFDGSSYVYGSDSGFPAGSNPRTISFFINLNIASVFQTVLSYGTDASLQRFDISVTTTNDIMIGLNGSNIVYQAGFLSNTWYHVLILLNGPTLNNTECYINKINSSVVSSVSPDLTINTTLNQYRIGYSVAGSGYLNGLIDQLRIFNRALTPDEISNLYNEKYPSGINDLYYYNPNSNVSFVIGVETPMIKQLFWHNF